MDQSLIKIINNLKHNSIQLGILTLFVLGCGGSVAMPVSVHQKGDSLKSCKGIEWDLGNIEKDISGKIKGSENAQDQNLAVMLLAGPLWIDSGQAQQEEIKAYKKRYNYLLSMSKEKGCRIEKDPLPEKPVTPKVEEGESY
jgi:hypothetical protein